MATRYFCDVCEIQIEARTNYAKTKITRGWYDRDRYRRHAVEIELVGDNKVEHLCETCFDRIVAEGT